MDFRFHPYFLFFSLPVRHLEFLMSLIRYAYDVTGINQTIDLLSLLAPDWLPPKVTTRTTGISRLTFSCVLLFQSL